MEEKDFKEETKTENISGKVSPSVKERIDDYCSENGISISNGTEIAWNTFLNDIEHEDQRLDLSQTVADSTSYIESIINAIEKQANAKIDELTNNYSEEISLLNQLLDAKSLSIEATNLSLESTKSKLDEVSKQRDEMASELDSKTKLIESLNLNLAQYARIDAENEKYRDELKELKEKYQSEHDENIKNASQIEGIRRELKLVYQNNADLKALLDGFSPKKS